MHPVARAAIAAAVILPIAAASIHSLCDLYFDCGCLPLWDAGAEHCNIHDPLPPNCPWCVGNTFDAVLAFAFLGAAAGIFAGIRLSSRASVPPLFGLIGYLASTWIASLWSG